VRSWLIVAGFGVRLIAVAICLVLIGTLVRFPFRKLSVCRGLPRKASAPKSWLAASSSVSESGGVAS
jgi:hypothetical protein